MAEKIRVEELILNEDELNPTGVFAVGLVSEPAHEENFIYMSTDKSVNYFAKASEEKHMIYGPAIVPNKMILRYDENGQPFNVFFSEETTIKLSQNFLKNFRNRSFTFQHEDYVEGATLVENWIINHEKKDKAASLGFELPKNTWMMGIKIDDLELWEKIKNGSAKGLSIEAYMASQIIENSKENLDPIVLKLKEIIDSNK